MITQPVKNDTAAAVSFLELEGGHKLAYSLTPGSTPGVVFLGGFRSDMTGTKAAYIEAFCREEGVRCLRFDYSGHGRSWGNFLQCNVGTWKQDTLDILDHLAPEGNVLVGSSLGAWLALLVAMERPQAVSGLVGIASAPDFTEALIWHRLSEQQKRQIVEEGVIYLPNCYGEEPFPITRSLIEEARKHLLLSRNISLPIPIRLVHGTEDEDVPWQVSLKLMECLKSPDISMELVKGGNHRLSEPAQLALIARTVEEILSLAD